MSIPKSLPLPEVMHREKVDPDIAVEYFRAWRQRRPGIAWRFIRIDRALGLQLLGVSGADEQEGIMLQFDELGPSRPDDTAAEAAAREDATVETLQLAGCGLPSDARNHLRQHDFYRGDLVYIDGRLVINS